ncbi:hypothetical protein [Curtobacterium sp. MCSS17_016]|uniref:hypothetical protein n=1 Tax=Curtobacterium sp. MCSS17_016 TaxID=2175644 RepID=UPI0011B454EA|nr:hypothetical protein [Curtobacterium sp. MCSS17_016]WIE81474.1 hypothetical protein DEJ19_019755 [Curtobacterium sp. MCSS17_016]
MAVDAADPSPADGAPTGKRWLRAVMFWVFAVVGVPVMVVMWTWLSLASLEGADEASKDPSSGTSAAGTTFWFGWAPLAVAHAVGFVAMFLTLRNGRRERRAALLEAAVALVIVSVIGCIVAVTFNGGHLLTPYPKPFQP